MKEADDLKDKIKHEKIIKQIMSENQIEISKQFIIKEGDKKNREDESNEDKVALRFTW